MAPLPHHSFEYISNLMQRSDLPLHDLKRWRPFKIDALGLVTLLGAEEVNRSVGTLQKRRCTEWLPFLAAFIVAGDRFSDEEPGYSLYNITDGIHTTELKGWFTRWLSSQDIRSSTTIFHWKHKKAPKYHYEHDLLAPLIGFVTVIPLLVCTILIGDWFGVGNSLAIVVSILVRKALLWQRRTALNTVAEPDDVPEDAEALPTHNKLQEKQVQRVDTFTRQLHRLSSEPSPDETVKMFVTRADGRMVTIYAPRNILSTFVKTAPIPSELGYSFTQWIGWTAFGAHIIVLGMSSLFTQIYTVFLLVLSTWAMCHSFAFDTGLKVDHEFREASPGSQFFKIPFTSCLLVEQENPPEKNQNGENIDKRMFAYVRAKPNKKQESMLKHWSMLPFEGVPWYTVYEQVKREHRPELQADNPKAVFPDSPISNTGSMSTAETLTSPPRPPTAPNAAQL